MKKVNVIFFNGINYSCGNFMSNNVEKSIKKVDKHANFTDMKWVSKLFGDKQTRINNKYNHSLLRNFTWDFIGDHLLYLDYDKKKFNKITAELFSHIKKGQRNIILGYSMGAVMLIDSLLQHKKHRNKQYIDKIVVFGTALLQFNYQERVKEVEKIYRRNFFIYWNTYDWLSTPGHLNIQANDRFFDPSPWYLYLIKKTPLMHLCWVAPLIFNKNINNFYHEIMS